MPESERQYQLITDSDQVEDEILKKGVDNLLPHAEHGVWVSACAQATAGYLLGVFADSSEGVRRKLLKGMPRSSARSLKKLYDTVLSMAPWKKHMSWARRDILDQLPVEE